VMVSATFRIFMLALGLIFHVYESKPLSNSGCACSSGCGKSAMGDSPWCYVESHCKVTGWDWCYDSQVLQLKIAQEQTLEERRKRTNHEKRIRDVERSSDAQVLNERVDRNYAETKMRNAERNSAALSKTLSQVQQQLKEEEKLAAELKHRLDEAVFQEVKMGHKAQDAEAKIKDIEQKLKNAVSTQSTTEKKLKEVRQKVLDADSNLKAAHLKQADTEEKLKRSELKVQVANVKTNEFKVAVTERLAKAFRKQANTEEKLQSTQRRGNQVATELKDAQAKQTETARKLAASEKKMQEVNKKMQEAEGKQHAAELRTFRLAVRGAVRGGTGVVKNDGTVQHWKVR